jgi:hypothetical protein
LAVCPTFAENSYFDFSTKNCASAAEELTPEFSMINRTGEGRKALKVYVSGIEHSHNWECL